MTNEQWFVLDSIGIVVAKRALLPETVFALNQSIDRELAGREVGKFSLAEAIGDQFFELMTHAWVMSVCSKTLGPWFRFDHAFGLQQPNAETNLHGGPHACQGSCFYQNGADGRIWSGRLSVGFALTQQGPETGGFAYIPGSHKTSFPLQGRDVFQEVLGSNYDHECIHVPSLSPGDICIFPDNLIHGTVPWKGRSRRRALYFMYSPGYMAWRPYDEISRYLTHAKTDLQRSLLRPPYVAKFEEEDGHVRDNQWRTANK